MKVITLSQKALKRESLSLCKRIQEDKFAPDIIIGIATGGIYISQPIKECFEEKGWHGFYAEIKLSRHTTKIKKRTNIKSVLQKLPYPLLNRLRMFEVTFFEKLKSHQYNTNKESKIQLPQKLKEEIKNASSLLLIDDAIDTGATVLAIKNVIASLNPNITIKVAVLTVTHKHPYIEPDYTNYKRALLRCPWAEDYKGEDKIG